MADNLATFMCCLKILGASTSCRSRGPSTPVEEQLYNVWNKNKMSKFSKSQTRNYFLSFMIYPYMSNCSFPLPSIHYNYLNQVSFNQGCNMLALFEDTWLEAHSLSEPTCK
jgi:hypothetical protein